MSQCRVSTGSTNEPTPVELVETNELVKTNEPTKTDAGFRQAQPTR
jgi:hypothetical protein